MFHESSTIQKTYKISTFRCSGRFKHEITSLLLSYLCHVLFHEQRDGCCNSLHNLDAPTVGRERKRFTCWSIATLFPFWILCVLLLHWTFNNHRILPPKLLL